jgi:hypothetical protein
VGKFIAFFIYAASLLTAQSQLVEAPLNVKVETVETNSFSQFADLEAFDGGVDFLIVSRNFLSRELALWGAWGKNRWVCLRLFLFCSRSRLSPLVSGF